MRDCPVHLFHNDDLILLSVQDLDYTMVPVSTRVTPGQQIALASGSLHTMHMNTQQVNIPQD